MYVCSGHSNKGVGGDGISSNMRGGRGGVIGGGGWRDRLSSTDIQGGVMGGTDNELNGQVWRMVQVQQKGTYRGGGTYTGCDYKLVYIARGDGGIRSAKLGVNR